MANDMLVFITGGVRSGKSNFAERMARFYETGESRLIYIATSNITDEEMALRVKRHQRDRNKSDKRWMTIESPINVSHVANQLERKDIVLLDCLTNLAANELFQGWESGIERWHNESYRREVFERIWAGIINLNKHCHDLYIVSNELFYDIPLEDEGSKYYLQLLGSLHQEIVSQADKAILVENGIPCFKKGGPLSW